jgi:hypothetical protein
VKKLLIEQSFVSPKPMDSEESLLAAANALDIRSRLMATEVPLSLYSVGSDRHNLEIPKIGHVPVQRPNVVDSDRPHMACTATHQSIDQLPCSELQMMPIRKAHEITGQPVRSAAPMLSLYTTVKITNIREQSRSNW